MLMPKKVPKEQVKWTNEGGTVLIAASKAGHKPMLQFNRDLSVAVLTAFVEDFKNQKLMKYEKSDCADYLEDERIVEIKILEAFESSGLKSMRYAKEVPDITKVIANDISKRADKVITDNVLFNSMDRVVEISNGDVASLMYNNRRGSKRFSAIDLDACGSPNVFLDAAVQSVDEGGLLLVTATDMAVLGGILPEVCYIKYGATSLRSKCCHEMALRILLQCIEAHANKYNRYIVPMLSVSVDFYIRVFVKVFTGVTQCKSTISKLSMVYQCVGCNNIILQPLGAIKPHPKIPTKVKTFLPSTPTVGERCDNCNGAHQMGGPIWSAPIHDVSFVSRVLKLVTSRHLFATTKRIVETLTLVRQELPDVPLFYTMHRLCGTMHSTMLPLVVMKTAIETAGYRVSGSHAAKGSIKTDAPYKLIWDILRKWMLREPIKPKKLESKPVLKHILSQPITYDVQLIEVVDNKSHRKSMHH